MKEDYYEPGLWRLFFRDPEGYYRAVICCDNCEHLKGVFFIKQGVSIHDIIIPCEGCGVK